jgi:hypothetical protein
MPRLLSGIAVGFVSVSALAGVHAEPASPAQATASPPSAASSAAQASAVHPLARSAADWRAWLAVVPALRPYAADFTLFTPSATDAALSRGKRSRANIAGWRFMDAQFAWSVGSRVFWIVSGKSPTASIVAVFAAGDAAPEHRASLVIAEPDAPLAVGLSAEHANELLFTTCYGCPGQSGSIQLTADGQPMFVYR